MRHLVPLLLLAALWPPPPASACVNAMEDAKEETVDLAKENQRRLTKAGLLILGVSIPVLLLPLGVGFIYQRRKQRAWTED